jgi:hypothetical protein
VADGRCRRAGGGGGVRHSEGDWVMMRPGCSPTLLASRTNAGSLAFFLL